MRSPEDIIHDLKAIEEYFIEETDGSAPNCLSEAVTFIQNEQRPDAYWEKIVLCDEKKWRCTRCGMSYPIQMNIKYARWCPWCRSPMKGEKKV